MSIATDAFTAALNKLSSDVEALVAHSGGVVDVFSAQATTQVEALDAKVVAALPAPLPPAA